MEFYWFVVVGCSSYVIGLWFAADEKGFSEKKLTVFTGLWFLLLFSIALVSV